MTKKNFSTIKNKLLSTSILMGLVASSVNAVAVTITPDHEYNSKSTTPITGNLTGSFLANDSGLTNSLVFSGDIDSSKSTHNNKLFNGMSINNSSLIFNKTVTSNGNNELGIYANNNSTLAFNGKVITNNNASIGMFIVSGSTATFQDDVTTNNNKNIGIFVSNGAVATFNGKVVANNTKQDNHDQQTGIYVAKKAEIIFNNSVTAVGNTKDGIFIEGARITFNGDVTAQAL